MLLGYVVLTGLLLIGSFNLVVTSEEPLKSVGDGLSSLEHGDGHEHNAEYDHEAFLGGKEEAKEYEQLTPEQSKEKLGELFHKVDGEESSDGFVTKEELKKWITNQQQKHFKNQETRSLKDNDVNRDGEVTWEEYEKVALVYHHDDMDTYDHMKERDQERFKAADVDGDGKLKGSEMGAFVNPEHHQHMHDNVFKETMGCLDKDKDGVVTFKEFIDESTSAEEKHLTEEEKEWVEKERKKFDEVRDKNKDGKLDAEEIKAWILPNPEVSIAEEADHLIKEADTDKDGKLSKEEMLEHHDLFVGSSPYTEYNDDLLNHDEL